MHIDWLARVKTRLLRPRRSRLRHFIGRVQRLEDRALLAAFVVDSTLDTADMAPGDGTAVDSQGHVTLRAAIQEANALPGADTITLPAGTFFLTSGSGDYDAVMGDLDLTEQVTIVGAGSDQTIIDGSGQDRVFDVVKVGVVV